MTTDSRPATRPGVAMRMVGEQWARRRGWIRPLSAMLLLAVAVPACGGSAEPVSDPPQSAASAEPSEAPAELELPPFTAPTYPLAEPKPDGFGISLAKFVTLPQSRTNPPVPRGDKLDRYNRINYLGEIPDGSGRLFVPDLNGMLYLVTDGKPTPYLNVSGRVGPAFWNHQGFGSGLSFAAFHPEFGQNGKLYTVHTEARGALQTAKPTLGPAAGSVVHGVLTEWTFKDPAAGQFEGTRRELMRLGFVGYIHGIQQIAFNPTAGPGDADYGLLYVAVGDGSAVGKAAQAKVASNVPQDLKLPQGKMLRIDPGVSGPGRAYGIPASNPYVARSDALSEIYASGLRDPYRFSWDAEADRDGEHHLLLGSMGENRAESIYDVHPGDNFGWGEREGPFVVRLAQSCEVSRLPADDARRGFVYPVAAYSHLAAPGIGRCDDTGHAVIGGFVYRGDALPELRGKYVFGDGVSGRVFYTDAAQMRRGKALAKVHELTLFDEAGKAVTLRQIAGDPGVLLAGKPRVDLRFGTDTRGGLYVLAKANGTIWKVTGTRGRPAPAR